MINRRKFLQASGLLAGSSLAPAFLSSTFGAGHSGTQKVGCLFSSSGAMANVEGRLNSVVEMAVAELNAAGGVLGKTIETVITDPASDWPLYAQNGRQLLLQEQCKALFGCWTSVSRKSVLPVVEQNDGLLYYPLHFEGEENSNSVVYMNSPPASSVLPALEYMMSEDGGSASRFYMVGSDYVWPRTINKINKGYFASKGITEESYRETYVPFGFSNFQNIINDIRDFANQPGGKPIIILTVVGNSIPAFFKEIINQGILASDIPILGLDVLEADLEGLDTSSLIGHLNCWAYLQNVENAENTKIKSAWSQFVSANGLPYSPDVMIDPMVSAYDGVHMWAKAVERAGTFEVPAVKEAFDGITFNCPSGYEISMSGENNYVARGVFIGSVNENQGFDILWQSDDTPTPVPYSPYA